MGQLKREVPGQDTLPQMDTFLGKSKSLSGSHAFRRRLTVGSHSQDCLALPCSMWDVETFGERHEGETHS